VPGTWEVAGAEEIAVLPSQVSCPYPPQGVEGVSVAGGVGTETSVVEEGTSALDDTVTSVAGALEAGAEEAGLDATGGDDEDSLGGEGGDGGEGGV
jgi:hypothetical protein